MLNLKNIRFVLVAGLCLFPSHAVLHAKTRHRSSSSHRTSSSKHKVKIRTKSRTSVPRASRSEFAPECVSIENVEALAPFFEALKRAEAGQGVARVLHFGDSHTAADYWTGEVRRRLQARFGDGGPGFIVGGRPWRGYAHAGVKVISGTLWPAQSLRGKECDGLVGLAGASLEPPAGEVSEPRGFRVQAAFNGLQVHVLGAEGILPTGVDHGPINSFAPMSTPMVFSELKHEVLGAGSHLRILKADLAPTDAIRDVELTFPEASTVPTRFLGVELLSGKPGVVYDELGLNGAELSDLGKWNPQMRQALLEQAHPDLVVLAYGTNESGRKLSDLDGYRERVRALIQAIRKESGAPILIVGTLDRVGTKKRARPGLYAGADKLTRELKAAAEHEHVAFWDARRAMGGQGALLAWQRQGLVQKDLVHLNGAGYQRLGDLMVDALLAGR